MDNITVYTILALFVIAFLFFVIRKNNKDRRAFEQEQNRNYKKVKDKEGDEDAEIERGNKL